MAEFPDRLIRNRRIHICRECATLAVEMIDRETSRRRNGTPPNETPKATNRVVGDMGRGGVARVCVVGEELLASVLTI